MLANGVKTIAKMIMVSGFPFSKMVALCKVIAKGVEDGATNAWFVSEIRWEAW